MPTTNKSLVQQVYNTSTGNLPANQVVDPAYISTPYPNWSVPVNYDFGALDLALGGLVTISVTGVLTDQTMVLSQYQPMFIVFSGTLSANIKYSLPSSVGGKWAVYNNTTGAFTLSMGSPTGPTTVTIPAGGPYIVTCNSSTGIALVNGYNAASSITTAMIQNDAVTTAKIADSSSPTTGVTTAKLASSSSTANGVTYAKMQYVSATSRLLGRVTAGSGVVEEVTGSQALDFIGSTQGQVLYRGSATWQALATGTNGQAFKTGGASANPSWADILNSGTVQNTTSGTAFDFTGLPSWVRRVIVLINGANPTAGIPIVQLGTSAGFETSSYTAGYSAVFGNDQNNTQASTAGFPVIGSMYGVVEINKISASSWIASIQGWYATGSVIGGGAKTLTTGGGILTQIRITGSSGAAFNAGSVNILYF